MKTIISWSGGKDSTATVILAHRMNIPVDEIIYAEVMYDNIRGISGEMLEMNDFIYKTAIPKFKEWGYKTTVLRSDKDYLDLFFNRLRTPHKKERLGKMSGYLIPGRCWASQALKTTVIDNYIRNIGTEFIHLIGICYDEPDRYNKLATSNRRSLLYEQKITESQARKICEQEKLLSPCYEYSERTGCWFCPNAPISQYAHLMDKRPELYREFIELAKCPLLVTHRFRHGSMEDFDEKVKSYKRGRENQLEFNFV